MGCWNETDAITHAPVFPGDKVVMVVYPEDRRRGVGAICHDFEAVHRGRYNDYGWLEDLDGDHDPNWALRNANREEPYERAVFFHDKTWAAVMRACKVVMKSTSPEEQATALFKFCSRNRIDPEAALKFKGMQHYDDKEYARFADMVLDSLAQFQKWMKQD